MNGINIKNGSTWGFVLIIFQMIIITLLSYLIKVPFTNQEKIAELKTRIVAAETNMNNIDKRLERIEDKLDMMIRRMEIYGNR